MKVSEATVRGLERMAARLEREENWITQQAFDEKRSGVKTG